MNTKEVVFSPEMADPELAQLEQHLQAIYTNDVFPAYPTWHQLRAGRALAASSKRRVTALRWIRPVSSSPRRFSLIMASVVLLVVLTAATTAGILWSLAQGEPGTQSLAQQGLFTAVSQSKTIDGFTITIETAYVDANRAILGITIKQPDLSGYGKGGQWNFGQIKLTTSNGIDLPATGLVMDSAAGGGSPTGSLMSFDAENILGNPHSLQLRANINYMCYQYNDSACSQKALAVSKQLNWAFQFSVPFHAGRIAQIHQSMTVNGKTVTLERVVVTPSETRAYISGLRYEDLVNGHSSLTIGEKTYDTYAAEPVGGLSDDGTGLTTTRLYLDFTYPLFAKHGTWNLSIGMGITGAGKAPGPWTFQFQVP